MFKDVYSILGAMDPPAWEERRPTGLGSWVIAVDHASSRIPQSLHQLGLNNRDLSRHIAYDIGALGVAQRLSDQLDAPVIWSNYSRLVIDCNRPLGVDSLIPKTGDEGDIPGNLQISDLNRTARIEQLWRPYHARIDAILDDRQTRGLYTRYLAIHSMTHELKGQRRLMDGAVLYRPPSTLGIRLAQLLRAQFHLNIAENEPYQLTDATDYSVPTHAEQRGLDYIELEMRQDLVSTVAEQQLWSDRLLHVLNQL
jgi:predicted N-formylglutamate amidohydrolase